MRVWIPHEDARSMLGAVPDGVELAVYDGSGDLPDATGVEFWVPTFAPSAGAGELAHSLPDLRVVQLMSAGADAWVGKLPEQVTLCDARGVHGGSTSEWAAMALLAATRDLPRFVRAQDEGRWDQSPTGELAGSRVLVVGAGDVGESLARRLTPFDVEVTLVARRARDGVHGVDELPDLLPRADAVVLVIPLTSATEGLVDAAFLARMRDGALLVNAARGPVVRTEDLLAELRSGRLRAALDVTDPEPLPEGHPLWTAPGLLLTPHVAGSVPGLQRRAYELIGTQLRRYAAGEPLENVVTEGY